MNGKVISMNLKPYIEIEAKGTGPVAFFSEDWLTVPKARMLAREVSRFPYIKTFILRMKKARAGRLKN